MINLFAYFGWIKGLELAVTGPGQEFKRCPSCVRLGNRKVLRAPGPRTTYFERFFVVQ